jgi:hypothetical protein
MSTVDDIADTKKKVLFIASDTDPFHLLVEIMYHRFRRARVCVCEFSARPSFLDPI